MTDFNPKETIIVYEKVCKYLKILRLREGCSANTVRAYGSDLMQVFQLQGLGKLQLEEKEDSLNYRIHWNTDTTPAAKTLQDWKVVILEQTGLWTSLSPRSKKRKWSSLRAFLKWLESEEGLHIDVVTPPSQKTPYKLPHFLSVDECLLLAKYLIKAEKDSPPLKQQTLLFFLMYGAGLRISEACRLQWKHVYFTEKKLIFKGKGNKERVVAAPALTLAILKVYGAIKTPFIWGAKALPERTAYDRVKQLGIKAGLFKPLNPHALRHSFASQLLTSGSDLRVLQQLLGHESLTATELYTHLDIDHLARSMENYHPLGSKE